MPRSQEQYLRDMADSAKAARRYVSGVSEEEFYANPMLQDAVSWRIQVIGEAATHVAAETQLKVPSLPWRLIRGMRNRLVHEYQNVRVDIVWGTTQVDLEPMITAIQQLLDGTQTHP
jgi:uncharacterized protein with HEPN domain